MRTTLTLLIVTVPLDCAHVIVCNFARKKKRKAKGVQVVLQKHLLKYEKSNLSNISSWRRTH